MGNVVSAGILTIGASSVVLGDVIADHVITIGQGTKIWGNLISVKGVSIKENVHIGGYVIVMDEGVALEKDSKAYDIIASGEIILVGGVTISDPVIWSKNKQIKVMAPVTVGANCHVEPDTDKKTEINPYRQASGTLDYDKLFEELKANLQQDITCED